MIIYKATNKINGMSYIGQTTQRLKYRKIAHKTKAFSCKTKDTYFYRAIKKYGFDSFDWQILEHCDSKEELDEMEFHYIKQYNTFKPEGYNLTFGGEGSVGYRHTNKTRSIMSDASFRSDKHVNRGKCLSKEWRKKISLANTNKIWSIEQRNNYRKARKNKFTGKDSKHAKKFVIITPENDSFYIIGLANFSRKYKNGLLDFRLLSAVATGKRNHHKNYKCRYFNKETDSSIQSWETANA